MSTDTKQERELGSLEAKVSFIVDAVREIKGDLKETKGFTQKTNGRVTNNEDNLKAMIDSVHTLSKSVQTNTTWRKNIVYAGTALVVVLSVLIPYTSRLAVEKAQSEVRTIISEEINKVFPEQVREVVANELDNHIFEISE